MEGKGVALTATAAALATGAWIWYPGRKRYDFRNKVVLITGGSRGLGLVLTRELLRQGAIVAVCARDGKALRRVRQELRQYHRRFMTTRCDITDPQAVAKWVDAVGRRFERIDALINNAGIISVGPLEVMDIHEFRRVMEFNFFGALNVTAAVLPEMRRRKHGRIINITSIGAKVSIPHLLPYNASKYAFAGFSEGLCAELAKDKITVTTVYPGLMRTGSPVQAEFKGHHREEYAWFAFCDALPFLSISAQRAARQILKASGRGSAVLFLSFPAKIGARFYGLFPGLAIRILGFINGKFLPGPGGIGKESRKGKESFSSKAPSVWTRLSDEASLQNNEMDRTEFKEKLEQAEEEDDDEP